MDTDGTPGQHPGRPPVAEAGHVLCLVSIFGGFSMISQIFLKHLQKEMERNCKQFHSFWSDFTIKDKFTIAEYNS